MEIKSVQKYLITSPRKLREIVPLIKDLSPSDAVERLPYLAKRAGEPLRKTINTAIANAKQKGASESSLIFKEIQINEGPRLKRFRAGARGRAKPYKRRMSHIRVVLETKDTSGKKRSRDEKVGTKSSPASSKSKKEVKARKQRKSAKKSA